MLDHYYAVIMAGGGGTRLWPLSRQSRPKQLLALFDERSMFQTSVDRILEVFPPDRIFVVTIQSQASALQASYPTIPLANYLIEPAGKGTASVVGLAAVALQQLDPQAVMAVLGSDYYISNEPLYRELLLAAGQAAQSGHLVTLGIQPGFASTGFGYIQRGAPAGPFGSHIFYEVMRFKEKPDQSTAEKMLADGEHYWNSGMFFWRVDRIMAEIKRQMTDLAAGLAQIAQAWTLPERHQVVEQVWSGLKAQTIDYGVMENAKDVLVLPASGLGWSDVGSWDALFDLYPADSDGNIVIGGEHLAIESAGSLVFNQAGQRLVVMIGVENLVLVDTGDVLMVCPKDQVQKVRQAVGLLKEQGKDYI